MKKILYSVVALQLLGVIGTAQAQTKKTWKISEEKVACNLGGAKDCLKIKKGCFKGWETFSGVIENFNYVEGNKYKIKVADYAEKNSAKLLSVVSTKQVFQSSAKASASNMEVLNNKLQIVSINGTKVKSNKAFLTINPKENQAFGNGGCNGFNGKATVSGNTITFGEFRSTMMACIGDGVDVQERQILEALRNKSLVVKQDGTKISLLSNNKEVIQLKLKSQQEVAQELGNHFWQLIMLKNVGQNYGRMGLNFDVAKGSIGGFGGCNTFGGDMKLGAGKMTISNVVTTMKACSDIEINKNEATLLQIMNSGTLDFDILGDILYLYDNGTTVATFNKQPKK